MTAMDHVWTQMKDLAATYSADGVSVSEDEARALITRLMQLEGESSAPEDAVAFLATEFMAMLDENEAGLTPIAHSA